MKTLKESLLSRHNSSIKNQVDTDFLNKIYSYFPKLNEDKHRYTKVIEISFGKSGELIFESKGNGRDGWFLGGEVDIEGLKDLGIRKLILKYFDYINFSGVKDNKMWDGIDLVSDMTVNITVPGIQNCSWVIRDYNHKDPTTDHMMIISKTFRDDFISLSNFQIESPAILFTSPLKVKNTQFHCGDIMFSYSHYNEFLKKLLSYPHEGSDSNFNPSKEFLGINWGSDCQKISVDPTPAYAGWSYVKNPSPILTKNKYCYPLKNNWWLIL